MSAADIFLDPAAWPLPAAAPLLAALLWLAAQGRRRANARAFGPRVAALTECDGRRPRLVRGGLLGAGVLLAGLALMQPAWGEGERSAAGRGVDVLVCLDVSRSMLARDQAPSRLLAARREIAELARRAQGDRLGLVVFAGEARLAVPLTRDVAAFVALAQQQGPLSVRRGGTDLGAALDAAVAALAGATGDHEVVLLLTDGEDHEGRGLRAAERCARRGITVHTVSFGARRGGKIPVPGEGGEVFLRDRSGDDVVTVPGVAALSRIAAATGGTHVAAATTPQALAALYDDEIVPMARKALDERRRQERENRFQWPLAAALVLFVLELRVADRRRR